MGLPTAISCCVTTSRPAGAFLFNRGPTTDITTENRFLQVTAASGADLTAAASKGDTTFSVLSKPGDSLLVATDERFDIVNVEVTKASFKWAGRWEYQSLLGWQPLAVQDGTGGLQRSGSVSFIPPRDWVPDSATNLYQVRLCCTRSRSGPTLRSVRSRDYIYLTANGYFFPGWQPLADTDGDGYLSPGERTGAASAHFAHEARVPAFWVGRYVMNVADPQLQQWTEVLAGIAANRITPGYDGIFVDNGWYAMPLDYLKSGGATCEPSDAATWQAGTMACLDAVRTGCGNGLVVLNTGNYTKPIYDQYLQHCDGWLGELWIRPSREFTLDLLTLPRKRDLAGKITLLHARLDPIDGDANRGKLLALSLFYLCAGERTYLFVGENYGAKPYQDNNWFGAMNASLGLPLGETMRLPASVPVYGRIFENGVVVARPLPRWDANYTDSEPVYLPEGYYQVLQADGTLGPVVTGSMVLRNAEGAILLRYL